MPATTSDAADAAGDRTHGLTPRRPEPGRGGADRAVGHAPTSPNAGAEDGEHGRRRGSVGAAEEVADAAPRGAGDRCVPMPARTARSARRRSRRCS